MKSRALLLAAAGAALCRAQWDDSLLKPFVMDHRTATSSPADVSFLLEAPAGKDGFVHVRNGHLVKGTGQRLRLWGVHLTDWSRGSVLLPSKEDSPMWASTLARFGVNCVRIHFLDLPAPRGIIDSTKTDSRSFDTDQFDRFDFLVAELKKRGIYIDLNLNVGRSYKAGDGVQDFDKIQWGKGLTLFDPRLIELQKEYAKNLLTHLNPYTKTEYRNEPAVAIVEILNENGIYQGYRAPTPYYENELNELWTAWLKKNRPGTEPVARLRGQETAAASKERYQTEMAFFTELENNFYQDMSSYLKNTLGVKVPITGTADHGHSSSAYPMLATLSKLDIVDGHVYWQHPGSPPPVNTPMVNDPLHSTIVQLSRSAVAGKPYTVSEVNHPFPNDWAAEGIPILAAYGALQDWDAIMLYTFEPKRDPNWKPYVGDPFDISLDPVRMTQMATGALTFLRGDVRPAKETIARTYSKDQTLESRRLPRTEQPYFTPGFPLSLPLEHAVRIQSFDGEPTASRPATQSDPIVSDTGELTWHSGTVTVETDRTQSLIGFTQPARKPLRNLSADLKTKFASIVLSSMDARPLARTERMLLTAGSKVTNTNLKWNEAKTRTANQGESPSLIEPVTGTVTLRNLQNAKSVTAQPLDGSGRPMGVPITASKTAEGWTLPLESVTTWYTIQVTR